MKSLSEVQKLTGLTRKQLRHYDDIKLVEAEKDKQGYWLYDDKSISDLMVVQLFSQADYRRREIKKILNMNQEELIGEFERLEEKLEAERRRIEGLINYMTMMKSLLSMPMPVLNMLGEFGLSQLCEQKPFSEQIRQNIEMCAGEKMNHEVVDYLMLLSVIALLNEKQADDEVVQQVAAMLFDREAELILSQFFADTEEKPSKEVLIDVIAENMTELAADIANDGELELPKQLGAEGWAFVREVIRVYREKHTVSKNNEEAEVKL